MQGRVDVMSTSSLFLVQFWLSLRYCRILRDRLDRDEKPYFSPELRGLTVAICVVFGLFFVVWEMFQ